MSALPQGDVPNYRVPRRRTPQRPRRHTPVAAVSQPDHWLTKFPLVRVISRWKTRNFLMVLGGGLTASLLLILVLNTILAQGSFQRFDIVKADNELSVRERTLAAELATYESPFGLESRVRSLGMVPAANPVYIDLNDGTVLGTPNVAAVPNLLPNAESEYINPVDGTGAKVTESANGNNPEGETGTTPVTVDSLPDGGERVIGLQEARR